MLYFDNAATSFPKPQTVSRAMLYALEHCANPGRAGHKLSIEAGQTILRTRTALAAYFRLEDPMRMIFTLNCTDALNTVIHGLLRPGDHCVTSCLEHNSVLRPLYTLRQRMGISISLAEPDASGRVEASAIRRLLRPETRLVVLTHASNLTGILQPVEDVAALCREKGIPFLADGAQTGGVFPYDLSQNAPDYLAFAGHKGFLGPQGVGLLVLGRDAPPLTFRQGGTGSSSESVLQPEELPDRLESGTQATPAIAGLGAGLEFLLRYEKEALRSEAEIRRQLEEGLGKIPGVRLLQPAGNIPAAGALAFNIRDMPSGDVANKMEQYGDIACRSGLHCAPLAHRFYGTLEQGAVRLSPGIFNTSRQADTLLRVVRRIAGES